MSKKNEQWVLAEAPISQAVMTLAIPTIISQLINIIYNFADTWFVGRTGNADMVAALSVCMPVFVIMAALANLFGIGGASVISRSLGQKNEKKARHVFAFCLYGGLAAAILYALVILLFRPQIIWLTGGTAGAYEYIYDYMFWTMILGAIPSIGNILCGHLVRSIGAARESGFGMSMGGILNIFFDPLFMFVILPPGHEITGAAIATLLANTCALLYFIVFLVRHRDHPVFTVHPKDISTKEHIPSEVFSIGIPAALQTTFAMISNIFANALVTEYGSSAVAGMGVAKKINMLAFNTTMGLTQGILPLLGYNYGAKNYARMKKAIWVTGGVGLVFCIGCMVVFRVFASDLLRFFIAEGNSVRYGTDFLKIIAYAAPLAALSYLANTLFQATGRRIYSFLLSTMRKGFLDIPAMFLFKSMIGINGVVWATPFAEVLSAVIGLFLFLRFMKRLTT